MHMIEFRQVSCAYEAGRPVLQDLNFAVEEGESVGIIGANGAGKSTVLKLLAGLITGSGEIAVCGMPVTKRTLAEVRRKLGFVLQDPDSQMFMPTVLEDMLFGPLAAGVPREEAEKKADGLLAELGISELRGRYNHRISGGEKRMAAIAAVLMGDPEVLLMDEPTSSLDPLNRRAVIRAVRERTETKLITSHDLDLILDTCSRVLLLSGGRIAADGPAEEILRDGALLASCRMELPLTLQGAGSR